MQYHEHKVKIVKVKEYELPHVVFPWYQIYYIWTPHEGPRRENCNAYNVEIVTMFTFLMYYQIH